MPGTVKPHSSSATAEAAWTALSRFIDDRAEQLVAMRRKFHAAPEASGKELQTTAIVAQTLHEAGLEPHVLQGGVGVVADIDLGAPGGRLIALRSELDCVGVNDDKSQPYASRHPGLCHACGHDAHTTMNLAAAVAIHEHRRELRSQRFRHNLRFIFQPAEETGTGARSMIEQGVLANVAAIFAVHVEPYFDVGIIGLRRGPMTAACRSFRVAVRGRGGHSARPHQSVDPIVAAANLVSQFYQLAPRSIDGRHPLALTVASIHAGIAANAIPDEAVMTGTLRTLRLDDAEIVQARLQAVCAGMAQATGCAIELTFHDACLPTHNDPDLCDLVVQALGPIIGPDAVHWIDLPSMGGEDFAYYQQEVPGVFVRLGAGLEPPLERRALHCSQFDINERALPIGAKVMAGTGLHLAHHYNGSGAAHGRPSKGAVS
jgi:amidohydrolase